MPDAPNREQAQAALAERLGRLMGKHHREIIAALGDPPHIKNIPPSLWDQQQAETEREMREYLMLIFVAVLAKGLVTFGELAFVEASKQYAARRSRMVAQRYIVNTRKRIRHASSQWRQTGASLEDAIPDVGRILGPARSVAIARTEVTAASSASMGQLDKKHREDQKQAKQEGREPADSLVPVWRLDPDCNHCAFCPSVADTTVDFYRWFVSAPPAHVHCVLPGQRIVPFNSHRASMRGWYEGVAVQVFFETADGQKRRAKLTERHPVQTVYKDLVSACDLTEGDEIFAIANESGPGSAQAVDTFTRMSMDEASIRLKIALETSTALHHAAAFIRDRRVDFVVNANVLKSTLVDASRRAIVMTLPKMDETRWMVDLMPQFIRGKVMRVEKFKHSGYVYDFDDEPYARYAVNGLVCHNCCCFIDLVPPDDPSIRDDADFSHVQAMANRVQIFETGVTGAPRRRHPRGTIQGDFHNE